MINSILELLLLILIDVSLAGFAICLIMIVSLSIVELIDIMKDRKRGQLLILIEEKLTDFCKNREIPITYGNEYFIENNKNNAAGTLTYYEQLFPYTTYRDFKIFLRPHDRFSWTVLAHEIGHFVSITEHNDYSEYGADYEASKLVRSFLSKKQQKLLYLELSIFFNENELKNFKHYYANLGLWPLKERETA